MNIKDFIRNDGKRADENNRGGDMNKERQDGTNAANAGGGENNRSADDIRSRVHNYKNMSEAQLMSEMMRIGSKEKASGNLDKRKLREFYDKSAPMLSAKQRNKLKQLINQLE